MSFKPIDPKRDEFRRYLERNGVLESLTKVFVRIVKERPENPLQYLSQHLGEAMYEADMMTQLRAELNEARCEVQRLRSVVQSINPQALEEFDTLRNEQASNGSNTEHAIAANEMVAAAADAAADMNTTQTNAVAAVAAATDESQLTEAEHKLKEPENSEHAPSKVAQTNNNVSVDNNLE